MLTTKISELEKGIQSSNPVEREAAKLRRKQLRELQRFVSDKANSLEDRLGYVQAKYTVQVGQSLKVQAHAAWQRAGRFACATAQIQQAAGGA